MIDAREERQMMNKLVVCMHVCMLLLLLLLIVAVNEIPSSTVQPLLASCTPLEGSMQHAKEGNRNMSTE